MPLHVVPFTPEHLDGAATLLAARHRADRVREPELPVRFEQPAEVRALLHQAMAWAGAVGVVALRGGEMAGYLLGRPWLGAPLLRERAGWIDYAGHAVAPDAGVEIARLLYAALAPRLLAAGCFTHYVTLPAADRQSLAVWFSLGFGTEQTRALRDTSPLSMAQPAAIEVHQAGDEDLEVVNRLATRLALYHTQAPIFIPYVVEDEAEARGQRTDLLRNPDHRCLLAMRDGKALAMLILAPPVSRAVMVTPPHCVHIDETFAEAGTRGQGIGTALLDAALTQAREDGYDRCTVGWMTANLSGARFWQTSGFRPLLYRLVREVDPRVGWANAAAAGLASCDSGSV